MKKYLALLVAVVAICCMAVSVAALSPDAKEAYFLIDDDSLSYTTRGTPALASSWNYDNRFTDDVNTQGTTTSNLTDSSRVGYTAINRKFDPQNKGVLTFESRINVGSVVNGVHIYFENTKNETVVDVFTKDNVFNVKTITETKPTSINVNGGNNNILLVMNLDKKTAKLYIDEVYGCDVSLGEFTDITKITFSTGVEEVISYTPQTARLYMNYPVYESYEHGFLPGDFVSEGAKIKDLAGNTLFFETTGKSTKTFEKISGKFVYEAYVYAPETADSAYLSLGNGTSEAIRVNLTGGKLTVGGLSVNTNNKVWQTVHIEGDTATGKADLFLNGRIRGSFNFTADGIDSVTVGVTANTGANGVYFDDLKIHNVYDYDDYCPEPVVAESKDYTLIMSVCSLWHEGTHSGWDFVSPYEHNQPILGYYDEGIPETADWEIKQMTEHGIDAQQFCWFVQGNAKAMLVAPHKDGKLRDALHDGYFYAKYKDKLDYCILWENASLTTPMTLDEFKETLWPFWVEYYFTDPSYLTINNKPLFEIYHLNNFITMFGGGNEAKAVISFMKNDIKKYGFDDIIITFHDGGLGTTSLSMIDDLGGDGIIPYAYDENSYAPYFLKDRYEKNVGNINEFAGMSFVPTIANGRNIMGWEDKRTPLSTPEQHKNVLRYAKDALNNQIYGGELAAENVIYFSTWNEFGEGHWLAPSTLNGYEYADEWRKAFTDAPEEHEDLELTEAQKNRIGHMYNDYRTPIRAALLDELELPEVIYWEEDFNSMKEAVSSGWHVWDTEGNKLPVVDGKLMGYPVSEDSQVTTPVNLGINADEVDYLHIRVKVNKTDFGKLYFMNDGESAFSEAKSLKFTIDESGEFVDILINMKSNELWKGTIYRVRIDFVNSLNNFEVDFIRFIGFSEQQKNRKIVVDGLELDKVNYQYITKDGGEIYVAGEPKKGLYSGLNFYHEWNRFTGKLYIKTSTDAEFNFTVGSSTALVNGTEMKLKKPFYLLDGIPALPLKFIFDNSGISYADDTDGLKVSIRGFDIGEIISSRKENEWEFNLSDDLEDWKAGGGEASVSGGNLTLIANFSASASTGYDSQIRTEKLLLPTDKYKALEVRMQYTYLGNIEGKAEQDFMSLYFATDVGPSYSEQQSVKCKLASGVDSGDGYVTYTFDLTSNELWTGMLNKLRFDPTNNNGIFVIDYIRLIEK